MVYLNLQIQSIIDALNDAGYIPESLTAGGATTATVEATATEPASPTTGDLWFNTSDSILYVFDGTTYNEVGLTAAEKEQLASLSTAVSQAQQAQLSAEDARDVITGMTAATGDAGTEASWDGVAGVLTVPRGDTGQGVDHTSQTAGTGAEGTTDTYTVWGDVAETINLGTFTVYNPVSGITDHTQLTNIGTNSHTQIDTHIGDDTKHRVINDAGTLTTELFSASKIINELNGKSDTTHNHTGVYEPADATIVKDADIGVTVQAYDVDTAKTDVAQSFTAPQRGSWTTKTTGTFALSEAQNFRFEPTANMTINVPTDLQATQGQCGLLYINASTYTISWGAGWAFEDGTAPTLSGGAYLAYATGDDYSGGVVGIACGSPVNNLAATT